MVFVLWLWNVAMSTSDGFATVEAWMGKGEEGGTSGSGQVYEELGIYHNSNALAYDVAH